MRAEKVADLENVAQLEEGLAIVLRVLVRDVESLVLQHFLDGLQQADRLRLEAEFRERPFAEEVRSVARDSRGSALLGARRDSECGAERSGGALEQVNAKSSVLDRRARGSGKRQLLRGECAVARSERAVQARAELTALRNDNQPLEAVRVRSAQHRRKRVHERELDGERALRAQDVARAVLRAVRLARSLVQVQDVVRDARFLANAGSQLRALSDARRLEQPPEREAALPDGLRAFEFVRLVSL